MLTLTETTSLTWEATLSGEVPREVPPKADLAVSSFNLGASGAASVLVCAERDGVEGGQPVRRRARHTGIGRRRRRECRRADRRRREWGCSRALTPADAAATKGRQPSDEGRRSGAVRAVTGWTTAASRVIARAVYRWWAGRQGDAPLTLVRPLAQQHRAGAEDGHQRSDGQRQADKMLGLAAAEAAPLEKEEGDSAPPQSGLAPLWPGCAVGWHAPPFAGAMKRWNFSTTSKPPLKKMMRARHRW